MRRLLIILLLLGAASPLFALSPVPDNRVVTSPNGQYRLELNRRGTQHVYRQGETAPLWSFDSCEQDRQFFLSTDGWVVAAFGTGSFGEPSLVLRTRGCETRLDAAALSLADAMGGWVRCRQQGNVLEISAESGSSCKVSLSECRVIESRRGHAQVGGCIPCGTPCGPAKGSDWLPIATYALLIFGAIYDIRRRIKER